MALKQSKRGNIPPFIVMDVMRAANAREIARADVIHLEVGQPSTPAPAGVLAAAERALRETAANQRKAFILNHVGNIVLSGGGLLILGLGFDTWKEGAT
ncbi:MAG TPA: hypothetical protein VIF14_17780, partial [Alphaproteobacteria bacterium]